MTYRNILLICILFCGGMMSCDKSNEVDNYFQEMMKIHHHDMDVWSEIYGLKKEINAQLDSLSTKRMEGAIDSTRIQSLQTTLTNLETADQSMNDWMHQFKKPSPEVPEDEAMVYLRDQMEKMKAMGQEVNDAVAEAKNLLIKSVNE